MTTLRSQPASPLLPWLCAKTMQAPRIVHICYRFSKHINVCAYALCFGSWRLYHIGIFTTLWWASYCLVHPGVRDKRRVSEIDLSQPRHETAFWWRHNGPVTSQLTDRIKWPNYPLELIGMYVPINTHNKESLTQRCRKSTNVQMCLVFLYIFIWFESKWLACLISHHK